MPTCVRVRVGRDEHNIYFSFHMTLERYRQRGAVTGNGRNNWATSLNCRPIRPSARRKWNGIWNIYRVTIDTWFYIRHPRAVCTLFRVTCSYAARVPSGHARTEREGEVERENSVDLNYRTHGGIARMNKFKLFLMRVTFSASSSGPG